MQRRFTAREITARQRQLAHLHSGITFESHHRADSEVIRVRATQRDRHAMAAVAVVAQQRHSGLIVREDEIEITVAIEISERRAEAHAFLIESPGRADVFETKIAEIAKRE